MLIYRLENPVQRYIWGSATGLSEALGIPNPGGGPLAELWMGAHPSAPSTAYVAGRRVRLDELIRSDPESVLGKKVVERLGPALPFLFKALSAGMPLSIQAHPGKRKAAIGFDRENLSGIPVDAPERNYRDANHKPEMAVALTRFELLCGFRPIPEIIENARIAAPQEYGRILGRLAKNPGRVELSVFFYTMISADERIRAPLLSNARAGIESALKAGSLPKERVEAFEWVLRLMDIFPDDMGALMPLILNHLILEPGEGAFIAPGELHAHLSGTCLEIMANSDNVIRGALSKKHVDIPELVSVLSFNPERLEPLRPGPSTGAEEPYPVLVPDFQLSRLRLAPDRSYRRSSSGPEILVCVEGRAEISCAGEAPLRLARGESAFVEEGAGRYVLASTEESVVFRAAVPEFP
jgi:mannose-6-phosphate isomerase